MQVNVNNCVYDIPYNAESVNLAQENNIILVFCACTTSSVLLL